MTDRKSYNGYTNYSTWCVCLWWNNEPGTYQDLQTFANSQETDYYKVQELKERTEDWVFQRHNDKDGNRIADLSTDLLGSALEDVNWLEIIEANKEE